MARSAKALRSGKFHSGEDFSIRLLEFDAFGSHRGPYFATFVGFRIY